MKVAVAIGFLALNVYIYHFLAREAVIPPRYSFAELALEHGEWECRHPEQMEDGVQQNLGVSDYHLCNWHRKREDGTDVVNVYVGYHATQVREEGGGAGENSIHPPAHCLPGSGWDMIRIDRVPLDVPGLPQSPALVNRLLIAKGNARQLVYYWYQSRGRVIAEDWKKILFVGIDRALKGRTDGSLVRFTVPIVRGDEESADASFQDLAPKLVPLLSRHVPS
jgi:EpsI family protein